MPDVITARLSEEIPQPELSKMWEDERTTFNTGTGDGIQSWLSAPEIVIETRGAEVLLSFLSGPGGDNRRLKEAFERAVHRYKPDVRINWNG